VEGQILHYLARMERIQYKASTMEIANAISLSKAQTFRYMRELEATGKVKRIGERGGWKRSA
jgi:DNA-binding IclR family transcriptional regulator